jgi:hypothetical protein
MTSEPSDEKLNTDDYGVRNGPKIRRLFQAISSSYDLSFIEVLRVKVRLHNDDSDRFVSTVIVSCKRKRTYVSCSSKLLFAYATSMSAEQKRVQSLLETLQSVLLAHTSDTTLVAPVSAIDLSGPEQEDDAVHLAPSGPPVHTPFNLPLARSPSWTAGARDRVAVCISRYLCMFCFSSTFKQEARALFAPSGNRDRRSPKRKESSTRTEQFTPSKGILVLAANTTTLEKSNFVFHTNSFFLSHI